MKHAGTTSVRQGGGGVIEFFAVAACCAAMSAAAIESPVTANYVLEGDETFEGTLTVNSGVTVDLAGHKLTVKGLGAGTGTITSTASGGVLEINVDGGATVDNKAVTLSGDANLQVWKTGAGTLVMTKANTGFGADGKVSMVIKAGYAKKANTTIYSCGAVGSKIVVEANEAGVGGQFDLNGNKSPDYDYSIAGSGPDGTGALVCSDNTNFGWSTANNNPRSDYGFFRYLSLDADATIAGGVYWCLSNRSMKSNPVQLNGHTLTIGGSNIIYVGSTDFRDGKIVVADGAKLGTANNAQTWGPFATNSAVTIKGRLSLNSCVFSPLKSLIFERTGEMSVAANIINGTTVVYDTYAPAHPGKTTNLAYPRVKLGKSGQAATLDLSRFADSFEGMALTTFASTSINVYTGNRAIQAGDKLVSWSSAPSGVSFTLVCDGEGGTAEERELAVEAQSNGSQGNGLYVISTSKPAYAVCDVANSAWKFYNSRGAEIEYSWGGDSDGEIEVRFASVAEYEAVKALQGGISPKEYVMHGFVLPAADPATTVNLGDGLAFRLASAEINGNTLKLPAATVGGATAGSVASSVAGGAVEVEVAAAGDTVTISSMTLSGGANIRLVKTGAGTLVMAKENSGFGGEGATSLVVRAGVAKKANAVSSPCGAAGSAIVVEADATGVGGQFDLNGSHFPDYDYKLSGSGPDGSGALVNSSGPGFVEWHASNSGNTGFLRSISLDADATLGGTSNWCISVRNMYSNPLLLNGHTLTFDMAASGHLYLGTTAFTGEGAIVYAGGVAGTAGQAVPSAENADVTVRAGAKFDTYNSQFSPLKSLVFDGGAYTMSDRQTSKNYTTVVYETYAPNLASNVGDTNVLPHPRLQLGDAQHLATTLDLTRFETAFNASTTTFQSGSTVAVDLSGRNANLKTIAKSESPYVVLWNGNTPAAGVAFAIDATTGEKFRLFRDATGLRIVRRAGLAVIIR